MFRNFKSLILFFTALTLLFCATTQVSAAANGGYDDWWLCANQCADEDSDCIDKCTDEFNETHYNLPNAILVPMQIKKLDPKQMRDHSTSSDCASEERKFTFTDGRSGSLVSGVQIVSPTQSDIDIPIPGTPFDVIIGDPCSCVCILDYCICNEDCFD